MRIFFISNTKTIDGNVTQHLIEECVCTKDWSGNRDEHKAKDSYNKLEDIVLETALSEYDDIVFVIDVHCTYEKLDGNKKAKVQDLQEQGGVVLYRHLLRALDELDAGAHKKLKVVFHSPIEQKKLVALKPENYVLLELPFVRANLDGTFGDALSKKINECISKDWPRFSNASENLLSGWALDNKDRLKKGEDPIQIDLHGNKPMIIDDEWDDWQITFKKILSVKPDYFLDPLVGDEIKKEFRKLSTDSFDHITTDTFSNYQLIIADLYLHERHETDRFKTNEFVRSISGFHLFRKIRSSDVEPAIPVILHTTSTKFKISETLRAFGSSGQVTKHNNHRATVGEKIDVYLALKENLEGITDEYSYCWRRNMYSSLLRLETASYLANIPQTPARDNAFAEVRGLLKNLLIVSGQTTGLDESYIESYFENFEVNPLSFGAVSIIRSVGLIPETLYKLGRRRVQTPELELANHLRNHASHSTSYRLFTPFDAELITILVIKSLLENHQRPISVPFPDKNVVSWFKEELTHPVFDYMHYYNHWLSYVPDRLKQENSGISGRIKTLARHYASSGKWELLSKEYKDELANSKSFSIKIGGFSECIVFNGNKCTLQLPIQLPT
ncbi:MAG: hypothetical protein HS105_05820 [Chloracidobacterium sp.]|nr:hypothetical protein [Chloracidobacterium sp.]